MKIFSFFLFNHQRQEQESGKKKSSFFEENWNAGYFNLVLCYDMLPHFMCKIWCLNEQNLMLCYAVLWFVMLTYFMSKILCSQWVKSCDLLCSHFWEIVIEVFVSKTLCTVMNSYLMSKILLYLMKLTVSNCNQELLETLSCLMKKIWVLKTFCYRKNI